MANRNFQHQSCSRLHLGFSDLYLSVFISIAALVADGCRLPESKPPMPVDQPAINLLWPAAPAQPRIRFVRTIARPADLGIERSFFGRLVDIIVGQEENWLIRPTGVVAYGRAIFIADAGAQAFWILDPQAGNFRKTQKSTDENLASPVAVAPGIGSRIYLADSYLRKVFVSGGDGKVLSAIADPKFQRPAGLAYDTARNRLYVADSAAHRVFVLTGEGKPIGAIGRHGSGDGEFNFPTHVAVDRSGNLYVTDALNFRLQMFDSEGRFTGKFGQHGDTSGTFASPKGVAVDSEGHIYIVDALFDAVQIFDRDGQYLLTFGQRGTGPGQFWLPNGIFIDGRDQIYVADSYNQRVQIFQYLKAQ